MRELLFLSLAILLGVIFEPALNDYFSTDSNDDYSVLTDTNQTRVLSNSWETFPRQNPVFDLSIVIPAFNEASQ
jgi:hypothetical protein